MSSVFVDWLLLTVREILVTSQTSQPHSTTIASSTQAIAISSPVIVSYLL